ncbi:MAG: asparagine synthase (glutamine-hydrolyzing) [Steroidobacteraceae bacterium]
MCGVSGIYAPRFAPVDRAAVVRMTRTLVHRGPDEEGFHFALGIGLGHRRLSIVDLASGQQPLCNEDRTIWVAFNGEIFNYLELRRDLVARGHQFSTSSDTETIVHAYEQFGLQFVEHLNGQFAIALWDERARRLLLVRDRVGIRPLFHATLPCGDLLFASEMKALLAHGALQAELDPVGLAQTASFWVTVPPRTSFKGIEELAPGSMLIVDNEGRRTLSQYWRHRFPDANDYEDRPLDYWVGETRQLLHDAVTLQLRADVPVASYLSGGLDSSIISALVKRFHKTDLRTFSVSFADASFDERAYQQRMAHYLDTLHTEIDVDASAIGERFSDVVWLAERPLMRTAPAPLLSLAGLVRRNGIKVVLTGEGADEVFGGYDIFREDKIRRFWAREAGSAWRPLALSGLNEFVRRDAKMEQLWREFFRKGLEQVADPFYSHRLRWEGGAAMRRAFSGELRAQMPDEPQLLEDLSAYLDPDRDRWHPSCRAQYLEMTLFMSCYLLNSQGDRMMMGESVEGRVPFLDHRVIEFAARIPPRYKIRGLNEKYVLKRAFADLLPREIVERPKKPYSAPIVSCFLADKDNLAAELLRRPALEESGLFNAAGVDSLLRKVTNKGVASERDEMIIATVASTQLLNHHYIRARSPRRTVVADCTGERVELT